MKIMHVVWELPLGGTENLPVDIANAQSKSASVAILIINDNIAKSLLEEIDDSIEVFCINRQIKTKNIFDLIKIITIIIRSRPTILHLHQCGLYKILRFTKLLGIPTTLTAHSTNYPCIDLKKHKQIFSISETVRLDLLKNCNINSTTILNGINTNGIRQRTNSHWAEDKPFKIVQVSRLHHRTKGQHILLFAVRKLIDDFQFTNFTLDFIGTGPSQDWLKALMEELNLQQHCYFVGEQSRSTIYNNLANYHLLIQPSLHEGFGLTMIEAMAAKIPVLASDIDAPKEVLKNSTYGTHFKNGNPDDMAEKLDYLLNNYNQTANQEMVCQASSYVEKNFNIKTTAQKYINHYPT